MASDAEIDLVVNATRALATVQRDLDELVRTAENDTDPVRVQAALNQILSLRRVQDDLNQVVQTAQARADTINLRADVDTDDADRNARRFSLSLGELTSTAGRALAPVAGLAGGLAKAGAAAGTAAPLMAGVVLAVESLIPAAALATSGLLTLKLATSTVQIAMIGVGDAIKTAFDPEATPEELAKAMEKLGPHAQSFVKELSGMRKGLKALQIDVQNRLFANLDTSLERTAKAVLPSLHGALDRTADSLNDMARGAAAAAQDLGDRGILGTALAHSTGALSKLERVPGQVVTAFGQLAAASGPALEGLATRAGGVADRIAEKLSKAFESGALEKAINVAISNLDQLGRVVGNVLGGIGNIIKGITVDGQGLFGTLEKVSEAFERLTSSKEFQSALQALSQTMGVLVTSVLPLLERAFTALLPVIEILAPPLQNLIKHLGIQLQPVIEKLGPVLETLAGAFVKLVPVLQPFVDLALRLAVLILPILGRLFEFLGEVFERVAPLAETLADNIGRQLEPILAKLPEILDKILPKLLELADRLFPVLIELLDQLGPDLTNLATAFADLLVELTPLVVKFLEFQIFLVDHLLPIIGPLVHGLGNALVGALRLLTDFINEFVIPGIRVVVQLFNGDWTEATIGAARIIEHLRDRASAAFESMKNRMINLAGQLLAGLVNRASQLGSAFVGQIQKLVNDAVDRMAQLPRLILGVLGGIGNLLFNIGSDLVQGLINGIISRIGGVVAAASKVANSIPGPIKGILGIHSPSTVAIGISEDFMKGLEIPLSSLLPSLRSALGNVAMTFPQELARPPSPVATSSMDFHKIPVNVYIGNERLNKAIDFRVDQSRRRNTRIVAQGVRR